VLLETLLAVIFPGKVPPPEMDEIVSEGVRAACETNDVAANDDPVEA
jgi:hypothetical protein